MNTDCINNSVNLMNGCNPFWDHDHQQVFYTDVFNGTVCKFDWNNQKTTVGRIQGENQCSFIIPVKDDNNKFVVGCGKRLLLVNWDGINHLIKIDRVLGELNKNNIRFNDAQCDNKGRLFIGTMFNEDQGDVFDNKCGGLFRFTMRDGLKQLKDNLGNVGGVCIDYINKKLMIVDMNDMKARQFDLDETTGDIKNEIILVDLKDHVQQKRMFTQGCCVDQEGNMYVCMNGCGKVLRINCRNRQVDQEIKFNTLNLTNCTFGGRDLDTLIVTTCQVDFDGKQKHDNNNKNNGRLHICDKMQFRGQKDMGFFKNN